MVLRVRAAKSGTRIVLWTGHVRDTRQVHLEDAGVHSRVERERVTGGRAWRQLARVRTHARAVPRQECLR